MVGKTLAHYEIVALLGAGGMGEVYRARDERLKRDVAIKVLPSALADDPDRLARLEREAQILAQLEHPNVAAIYGIEEDVASDGQHVRFLVMQLADGDTLDDIMAGGAGNAIPSGRGNGAVASSAASALPLDTVLDIAGQIADALEAAHDKGIVHRDLKPANVKVAVVDGEPVVKVLDFGLAKAFEPDGSASELSPDLSASPTVMAATGAGMIMGTAGYMSPEQARGQPVDKRADVWAFGVVLYEMLAGKRLFGGDTVSDTLASVLKDAPDFDALPAATPDAILRLLRRCLAREPRRRLRDIGDARLELEEALAAGSAAAGPKGGDALPEAPAARLLSPQFIGVTIGLVAVTALVTWSLLGRFAEPSAPRQFLVGPEEATQANISPDGTKLIVWVGEELFVRDIDSLELRPLADVPGSVRTVAWSPDSSQIAYFRQDRIVVADVVGSTTRELDVDGLRGQWGLDWGPVGILAADRDNGLTLVPVDGSVPRQVARVQDGFPRRATLLPDGRTIVYNVADLREGVFAFGKLVVQHGLDAAAERTIIADDSAEVWGRMRYAEAAEVLLASSGGANPGIWAFPLSRATYEPSGPAYRLLPDSWPTSVSGDGTLIYTSGMERLANDPFIWVDREGNVLETIQSPRRDPRWPSLSPDGTKIVFRGAGDPGAAYDMWVFDLVTGSETRITAEPGTGLNGDWFDNARLIYAAGRFRGNGNQDEPSGLAFQLASGLGAAETRSEEGIIRTPVASRDGRFVAYARRFDETGWDIHYLSMESGEHGAYLSSAADEQQPALSPDGRLIAYISDASGTSELWVSGFPEHSTPVRVSPAGAGFVRWSSEGDEIFFNNGRVLWAIPVDGGAEHGPEAYGTPVRLFAEADVGVNFESFGTRGWDAGPNGERFLMVQRFDNTIRQTPIVIQDFADWLRTR